MNAQGITIKNSKIIGSTKNIIVIIKNSKDVTIDGLESTELHTDRFFISNSENHVGISEIQRGTENIKILNSKVTVSPDKSAPNAVMAFHDVQGLTVKGNTIISARNIPIISLANITDLLEANNHVITFK